MDACLGLYFVFLIFQMEEFMRSNFSSQLDLPSCRDESTIFEYYVNDNGEWDHWDSKVCSNLFTL